MSLEDSYYDVKFKEDPRKYFKVSLKYLNVYFNGNGKNMSTYIRCCELYNNGKIKQIQKINEYLQFNLRNSNPKKKLMLIVFSNFLIKINELTTNSEINDLYDKTIKYIDPTIHLGIKIQCKINEIKNYKLTPI